MTSLAFAVAAVLTLDPRIEAGLSAFNQADFAAARDGLALLVDDPAISPGEQAVARQYLAASYHVLGDVASAKAQLIALGRRNPNALPDPLVFFPEPVPL